MWISRILLERQTGATGDSLARAGGECKNLVYKSLNKDQMVYYCEICGFGYDHLETAEACEEFCNVHDRSAAEITDRAIRRPAIQVV
jgi:hypothetical protein